MASLDGSTGGRAVEGGYSVSSPLRLSRAQVVDGDFADFGDFGGGFGDFAADFGDVDARRSNCSPGTVGTRVGPGEGESGSVEAGGDVPCGRRRAAGARPDSARRTGRAALVFLSRDITKMYGISPPRRAIRAWAWSEVATCSVGRVASAQAFLRSAAKYESYE